MKSSARLRPADQAPPVLTHGEFHLSLLGGFELRCDGDRVELPLAAQRLIAFVALRDSPVLRPYVAGTLWMDTNDDHASHSLRTAMWRLHESGLDLLQGSRSHVWLDPGVSVDWRDLRAMCHRVLRDSSNLESELFTSGPILADLLLGWYDDWVTVERERFRQLRLHALERLAIRFTERGEFGLAVEAGQTAVAAEPLRESAHRLIVLAHLAEGNRWEALRQFRLYRDHLRAELDIEPSPALARLLAE